MRNFTRQVVAGLLRHFIARFTLDGLVEKRLAPSYREIDRLRVAVAVAAQNPGGLVELAATGSSQLGQDVLAAALSGFRNDGFFVEVGAADGVSMSNSLVLEKQLGWSGILVEPARGWHRKLERNRSVHIDFRAVHEKTGREVVFLETPNRKLSTIKAFASEGPHARERSIGKRYKVPTVSLNDLLAEYGAPSEIDFLSLDTEGSESSILASFDFTKYTPSFIAVEHNHGPQEEELRAILERHGFVQILKDFSQWDGWWIRQDHVFLSA